MSLEPKWKQFEFFVKKIQEQLTPNSVITHNEMVMGKSGIKRQVDISLRSKIGQFDIFIAIECKDYNKPIDIKVIEEFAGLVEDIQATKGAIITYIGFTEAAKKRAKLLGIDLYRILDAENKEWPVKITVPFICDIRGIKQFCFAFSSSYEGPSFIPNTDPRLLKFYNEEHKYIGETLNYFIDLWNNGGLNTGVGKNEHKLVKVYITKNGSEFCPLDITFEYEVEQKLFLGHADIKKLQGMLDENTGGVITKGFIANGSVDFKNIEKTLEPIKDTESIPKKHLMTLVVLNIYPHIESK